MAMMCILGGNWAIPTGHYKEGETRGCKGIKRTFDDTTLLLVGAVNSMKRRLKNEIQYTWGMQREHSQGDCITVGGEVSDVRR